MPNQNPESQKYDWKDHELDFIFHHGIKVFIEKKIDEYELLDIIEMQMSKAIERECSEAKQEEREAVLHEIIDSLPQKYEPALSMYGRGFNNCLEQILDKLECISLRE